jgi:hypothetical protein
MFDKIQETFDYPTGGEKIGLRAEKFLRTEVEKLGGYLRKQRNPHDFGDYPSFEAFFADNEHDSDFCEICESPEFDVVNDKFITTGGNDCEAKIKDDKFWESLNKLIDTYNHKFDKWL